MIYDFLKSKGILEDIKKGEVIDIGSGDGREGDVFKENGYFVTSIDTKDGIDATTYSYPTEKYDVVIANNSLPFMKDKQLDVILNIYKSLKNGGYFYGTVFGKEEPWAETGIITALDFNETITFFKKIGFTIIWQSEEKGLGKTMKGDFKNWHILKFLVKK